MFMFYFDGENTVRVEDKNEEFYYNIRKTETTKINNLIELFDPDKYIPELENYLDVPGYASSGPKPVELVPGKLYQLNDGFRKRVWKVIKTSEESVIVILFSGVPLQGYSYLMKESCEELNLDFRPDYIILPKNFGWKEFNPEYVEFDGKDVSTYPHSGRTIKYLVVKIKDILRTQDPDIVDIQGKCNIESEILLVSLKVEVKKSITGFADGQGLARGTQLSWSPIQESFRGHEKVVEDDLSDYNGNFFIIVKLGEVGVSPMSLKGMCVTDFLDFSWDTSFKAITSEQTTTEIKELPPSIDKNIFESKNGRFWRVVENGKMTKLVKQKSYDKDLYECWRE